MIRMKTFSTLLLIVLSIFTRAQDLKNSYENGHGGTLEIIDYQPKKIIKVHLIYKSDVCDLDLIAELTFSMETEEGLIYESDNIDYLRINYSTIQFYPGSLGEGNDVACDESYQDRFK